MGSLGYIRRYAESMKAILGVIFNRVESEFYLVIRQLAGGKAMPGLFNVLNEDLHRVLKKPIAGIYSMSNLVSFEPYVDSTMRVFFEELDHHFVETNKPCEFDTWLQMFAFYVMGETTFSKRLGFPERGEDVDGIMASIWTHFQYTAPVSNQTQKQRQVHKDFRLDKCLGLT